MRVLVFCLVFAMMATATGATVPQSRGDENRDLRLVDAAKRQDCSTPAQPFMRRTISGRQPCGWPPSTGTLE
jgi:hypothetical protein